MSAVGSAAVVDRKEALDLLADLLAHYTSYHNHKEAMAWAGVVFYSGLTFAFLTALRDRAPTGDYVHGVGLAITVWLLATCAVCYAYLRKQFELRQHAANYIAACIWLRAHMLSDSARSIIAAQWLPLERVPRRKVQSVYTLPRVVVTCASELASFGGGSRLRLELCAYGLVAALLMASLTRV